jgi:hypothetical protein
MFCTIVKPDTQKPALQDLQVGDHFVWATDYESVGSESKIRVYTKYSWDKVCKFGDLESQRVYSLETAVVPVDIVDIVIKPRVLSR